MSSWAVLALATPPKRCWSMSRPSLSSLSRRSMRSSTGMKRACCRSDLPLELGEGEEHIEREPPHAGGRVEGLRHRDEGDPVLVEQLDQLGEVGKRSGEPVDLVDHHDVDLAGPD